MDDLNWLARELALLKLEVEKVEDPAQLVGEVGHLQTRIAVARLYTEFLRANQIARHRA